MSIALRRAIYGKLAGDTTLTGYLHSAPTGHSQSIYFEVAPQAAQFPFVVFSKSSGVPVQAMRGGAAIMEDEVWQVKGVSSERQGGTISDADASDRIASRVSDLLSDGTLSISGRTQLFVRREMDLVYAEVVDGVTYRHAGAQFRIVTQPS